MQIFPDYPFINFLTGKPITDPKKPEKELQLRHVVGGALMTVHDSDALGGAELQARYELGLRIFRAEKWVEVSDAELAKIKDLAARMYKSPLITGQLWYILDCWAQGGEEENT